MKPELKSKWLKALRSGKYRQTTQCLKRRNNYCCLGVLATVAGAKWSQEDGEPIAKIGNRRVDCGDGTLMPGPFRLSRDRQHMLISMNDGGWWKDTKHQKHNFKQISDWVEKNIR